MSDFPMITLITPVLNGARFIEKAVDSVLAQNYPVLEYIVMDAGSTDGTLEILKKYGNKIKLISGVKDKGAYDAYNKALKIAQGDIIGMLSADDWLSAGILSRVGQIFVEQPDVDVVTVGTQLHFLSEKDGVITPGEIFHKRYYTLNLKAICELPLPNSRFVKKVIYQQHGFFQEGENMKNYSLSADLELMLRLSSKNLKNSIDETVGYNFLVHSNSLTSGNNLKNKLMGLSQKTQILKEFLTSKTLSQKETMVVENALQRNYVYIIVLSLFSDQSFLSKDCFKQAYSRYGVKFFLIFLRVLFIRSRREFSLCRRYFSLGWSRACLKSTSL